MAGTDQYLTFTGPSSAGGQMRISSATETIVVGGIAAQSTNIQSGIFTGMSLLAEQEGVAGDVQRLPSTIVFSDGEPTLSSTDPQWWDISLPGTHGPRYPGENQYYGNRFKAAMTAAYLRNVIGDVYNDEEYNETHGFDPVEARVYTIGLGLEGLSDNGRNLALATLDPRTHYGSDANTMSASFTQAFTDYAAGAAVRVPVGAPPGSQPEHYIVNRPTGAAAQHDVTDLRYNVSFDDPDTAEDLVETFERIAAEVVDEVPVLPVEVESADPNADGYVTFTDPLGDFMHVTDVSRITYCSVLESDPGGECEPVSFDQKSVTEADGVRTYVFEGSYQANDLFPETDIGNIVITVETSPALASGDVVTVRIPVSLLPMRDTHVTEDGFGDPQEMTWYASHPVHVFYTVAPKPDVAAALGDPSVLDELGHGDGAALSDYLAEHAEDGQVRFFTNAYATGDDGAPEALTTATFRPSAANNYYRYAEDAVLYLDDTGQQTLDQDAWEVLGDDAVLYRSIPVYTREDDGSVAREDVYLPTTKAALLAGEYADIAVTESGGVMVAPAGLYNLSERTRNIDIEKCAPGSIVWVDNTPVCEDPSGNLTETDPMARATTILPGQAQSVRVDLGNNGYLSYAVPGSLVIAKEVAHPAGLTPDPAQTFSFQVSLADAEGTPLDGEFAVTIRDSAGEVTGETTIADGGTLELPAGHEATVTGLPHGAQYEVLELDPPPGYTLESPASGEASGSITTPQEEVPRAEFVNSYAVSPVTVDSPEAVKALDRDWLEGDVFTMRLCAAAGSPLPEGAGEDGCVSQEVAGPAGVGFGDIEFTAPGEYDYTLTEVLGELPGLTYSAAEYRWRVTVTDDGAGALEATSALTLLRDDAGAVIEGGQPAEGAVFTNLFDAAETTVFLPAEKLVLDHSLPGDQADQTRAPALGHEFLFETVPAYPGQVTPPPLFGGSQETATVANLPGSPSVTAPGLTFTEGHVGETYFYRVTEVPGGVPAVAYDDAVWFYRVTVLITETAAGAVVDPVVALCVTTTDAVAADAPWGDCSPQDGAYAEDGTPGFLNEYAPGPGAGALDVTKALDGRDWAAEEVFDFALEPGDPATAAAVADGRIVMPDPATLALSGSAADGETVTGAFEAIGFTTVGSYSFRIVETPPDPRAPGMVYDPGVLVYDVAVSADFDSGALAVTAEPRATGAAEGFVNTYRATTPHPGVEVIKTLTGREMELGEFTFHVRPVDEVSRDKAGMDSMDGRTFTNPSPAADGAPLTMLRLPGLSFSQADLGQVFSYEISEEPGQAGGVTYDDTVHTVTIEPAHDPETGELYLLTTADGETYDSRDPTVPTVSFANTYAAAPAEVTVPLDKVLTGRDWEDGENVFDFELTPLDDAPAPQEPVTSVGPQSPVPGDDASVRRGEVGPILIDVPGTYRYELRELAPEDPVPGMTYSDRVATITVLVTDDGSGTLQAEVRDDRDAEAARFDNVHRSPWQLEIAKTLTGRDLAAGEFTFEVVPADEASAELAGLPPEGETFTHEAGADGEAVVMTRSIEAFLDVGNDGETFCYTYSELVPDDPLDGVTYDDRVYELCVTVTEEEGDVPRAHTEITELGSGEVVAEYDTTSIDVPMVSAEIAFENTYATTPPPDPTPPDPTPPPAPRTPGPRPPTRATPATRSRVPGRTSVPASRPPASTTPGRWPSSPPSSSWPARPSPHSPGATEPFAGQAPGARQPRARGWAAA